MRAASVARSRSTFHNPDHPSFSFQKLFEGLKAWGFIIFPGRLALADTFRIGCMGAVTEQDMAEAMTAIAETMLETGDGRHRPRPYRPRGRIVVRPLLNSDPPTM